MRRLVLVLLLAVPLAACGGSDSDSVAVPKGVTFRVEQARQDLQNRHFELQVVNHGPQHRSEAAAILTGYGYSPGELDFTVFLNEQH